jgi:hypothetical protein
MVELIRTLVDAIVETKSLDSGRNRAEYTANICHAFLALDPQEVHDYLVGVKNINTSAQMWSSQDIPSSVASAIGDLETLRNRVHSLSEVFNQWYDWFPNALNAAVACGQTEVLQFQLDCITHTIQGLPKAGDWTSMRMIARKIGDALSIAIRLHRNVAAHMIFDYFESNNKLKESASSHLGESLFKDAVQYGNNALLYRTLDLDQASGSVRRGKALKQRHKLRSEYVDSVLSIGKAKTLVMLLQDSHLDPNQGLKTTLVYHAMTYGRPDLARILLENGGDVDAPAKRSSGKSALWHAVSCGNQNTVEMLLSFGADPNCVDVNSPLGTANSGQVCPCEFLLRKVKENGKDYLERTDLWDVYADEEAARRR